MQLGVSLETLGPSSDGELALRTATKAEGLGFDYVLMSGHVLASRNGSAMDPIVLLSAVSGATSRIGLATSVLVLPYYDPVILANQAASLDVISGGRLVLAVGTGWNQDEFDAVGVPLAERGARTDEYLGAMKELWSPGPAYYEGRFGVRASASRRTRPAAPRSGWADTATRPCGGRCTSPTAGTAPGSTTRIWSASANASQPSARRLDGIRRRCG